MVKGGLFSTTPEYPEFMWHEMIAREGSKKTGYWNVSTNGLMKNIEN